jgi:hypothetical protein
MRAFEAKAPVDPPGPHGDGARVHWSAALRGNHRIIALAIVDGGGGQRDECWARFLVGAAQIRRETPWPRRAQNSPARGGSGLATIPPRSQRLLPNGMTKLNDGPRR